MAYGDSNGHVTDDVTWPRKVRVVTQICLEPDISKTAGDAIQQWLLITRSSDKSSQVKSSQVAFNEVCDKRTT